MHHSSENYKLNNCNKIKSDVLARYAIELCEMWSKKLYYQLIIRDLCFFFLKAISPTNDIRITFSV